MAAHSVPGKPILPTSPSLPASSSQPPSDLAVGASPYDRMQADVKALQQQAQATQASLKKLQTQEAVDPVAAIVSEIPSMPEVDSALVGVGAVLLVALALVWWTLWRRPKAQWVDAQHSAADSSAVSELSADSAFAPQPMQAPEPNMGFDSEAAATEVIRVRKSLAEKREARFLLRESEEPTVPLSSPEPALDLDLELAPEPELPAEPQGHTADPWSMPGEGVHHDTAPSFDIDIHFTLPDAQDASDAPPEPEPEHEPEHEMKPTPDQILDAIELDFNLDEPAAVDTQPEPAANSPVGPDYATTLALAQVSEELEQLNEARDLAYEVLQSDDPALQSEARALLERLSEVESEMGPESVRWDDLR